MPLNTAQKISIPILSIMLAALVTLSPFAIDSYLAAMPIIATYFGVHISVVELTISLYFLGFAIGNFLGGPLSDSYGRKTIALTGIAIYAISSAIIPFCNNIELVLLFRVTQAFGGGFASVTANIIIRDMFTGKQVARLVTIVSMIMMLAPLFAPVIGVFLIHLKGWQGVFYFLFGFALLLFILFYFSVPESRSKALITRKLSGKQLWGKYQVFFSHRLSVITLLAISFSMSGLYIFLTGASFIYLEFFKVSQNMFPIYFGSNVILNILLSLLNTFLLKRYKPKELVRAGLLIQLLAGLIIFLAVIRNQPQFIYVFSGIVLYIGSLGLIFGNGTAVILNFNPAVSGSANATIGISRFLLSFIIGTILSLFHAENLAPIGTIMFGCTLLANVLFVVAMVRLKKENVV